MPAPRGLILLWSGAIVDIPSGFVLCNGNNGTPDLRDKFVVGAGDSYAVNDSGGADTHTHDFTTDGHNHYTFAGAPWVDPTGDTGQITTNQDTGTTDAGSSLPPYYALAFIMKT